MSIPTATPLSNFIFIASYFLAGVNRSMAPARAGAHLLHLSREPGCQEAPIGRGKNLSHE